MQMLEYKGWDTMAVLNQRQEKIERDRQRAAADKALRDHFAAAALTGLVNTHAVYHKEPPAVATMAYAMADAMLRERCRAGADCPVPDNAANLDAAPAARASEATASPERVRARGDAGTGDTQEPHTTPSVGSVRREGTEPVAWGVASHFRVLATSISRIDAVDMQSEFAFDKVDTAVVPLYRHPQPTLTDAEREAVDTAEASLMRESTDLNTPLPVRQRLGAAVATLRGLLERLGGGR